MGDLWTWKRRAPAGTLDRWDAARQSPLMLAHGKDRHCPVAVARRRNITGRP
jgi:hypothetical protein